MKWCTLTTSLWKSTRIHSLAIALCAFSIALAAPSVTNAALFTVAWDRNPEDTEVVKFRVYRASAPEGPYSLLKTVTTTSAGVEVPVGEARYYRIRAVDSLGQVSPLSEYCGFKVIVERGP